VQLACEKIVQKQWAEAQALKQANDFLNNKNNKTSQIDISPSLNNSLTVNRSDLARNINNKNISKLDYLVLSKAAFGFSVQQIGFQHAKLLQLPGDEGYAVVQLVKVTEPTESDIESRIKSNPKLMAAQVEALRSVLAHQEASDYLNQLISSAKIKFNDQAMQAS